MTRSSWDRRRPRLPASNLTNPIKFELVLSDAGRRGRLRSQDDDYGNCWCYRFVGNKQCIKNVPVLI